MNEDVRNSMVTECKNAIESGNVGGFVDSMVNFMNDTEKKIREDYEALKDEKDEKVLSARGYKVLTSAENSYYDALRTAIKNDASLSNIDKNMPITIVDRVFEQVKTNHPLLDAIDWINTGTLDNYMTVNTGVSGTAGWGELCGAVDDQISSGFARIQVKLNKLSCWMDICLSALELGNTWLDRYCVEVMGEQIALALEDGIINGTGSNQPIGMIKTIANAGSTQTIPAVTKSATSITKLDAVTLGTIAKEVSNGGKRAVGEMIMVCSINDYFTKVMPAIQYKNALGEYVVRTPLPLKVIPSAKMTDNKAVFGIGKKYVMCAGTGKEGRLARSDEYRFLDDVRVLKLKVFAGGQPMDNKAFYYADITNLVPDYFNVATRQMSI